MFRLLISAYRSRRPLLRHHHRLSSTTVSLPLRPCCCILAVGLFLRRFDFSSSSVRAFTATARPRLLQSHRITTRAAGPLLATTAGESELVNLRVPELKERLRARGLKVGGRKAELIKRLLHFQSQPSQAQSSSTMPPSKRKATMDTAAATSSSVKESVASKKKTTPAAKKKKATKAKAKADHQRQTERTPIPKLWDGNAATSQSGSYTLKIMSWNVAGLRALLKNHPTALADLATRHGLDVICLQETKLQEVHVTDPKLKIGGCLLNDEGYDGYYSCSTTKKGYSGTAVFVKRRLVVEEDGDDAGAAKKGKKQQASLSSFFKAGSDDGKKGGGAKKEEDGDEEGNIARDMDNIGDVDVKNLIPAVSYGIDKAVHDAEGRAITLDFPQFTMTNLYVPNSGQKLDRLSYRTQEWDTHLLAYIQKKEKERNCPIIWLGDLNVAHTAKETWNEGAKHLPKSAGTTPEERASFQSQLDAGYVDAFRHLHPDALGHYSYWSQRASNRDPNKGLRLDYFVCSKDLLVNNNDDKQESKVIVRDSYMLPDQKGSDHCPLILELEIKG